MKKNVTSTTDSATIDQNEVNHFAKDSAHWWDENGPFKPLHRLNPVRMSFIKDEICAHYDRDTMDLKALNGLDVLDIGCGGGLVSESLARMGANVTGVDADANAISLASLHAADNGLSIDYICGDAAHLEKKYDAVCALEIIEHVADIQAFIDICVKCLKPDGILIMSTLNRTPKSYALGIFAAENILGWVPRGTHQWKKFVKPSQIAAGVRKHGLAPETINGIIFNPIKNRFELSKSDLDVNYIVALK